MAVKFIPLDRDTPHLSEELAIAEELKRREARPFCFSSVRLVADNSTAHLSSALYQNKRALRLV